MIPPCVRCGAPGVNDVLTTAVDERTTVYVRLCNTCYLHYRRVLADFLHRD